MAIVRPLEQIGAADVDAVGGKAANLGELVRANFAVPDGFVLTTDAYAAAAQAAQVDPGQPTRAAEQLASAPVPAAIASAALEAYARLGGGRVAVRSSATAEDLPGASFAGQQDTYLNVARRRRPAGRAYVAAGPRCGTSGRSPTEPRMSIDNTGVRLAVVVQHMVPASAAGVIFTADPLTGRRKRAVDRRDRRSGRKTRLGCRQSGPLRRRHRRAPDRGAPADR